MTEIEGQVRGALRERAASITPSADGFERIEAKLDGDVPVTAAAPVGPRRRFPVLAAAAAVVVAGVIGAVLVAQQDDSTRVEGGPLATAPTTAAPASSVPLGVWPWPGDAVDPTLLAEAEDAARTYVESRVGHPVENGFVQAAGEDRTVTFTGDVSTTVFLRQHGERWYVESATSDLVTLHDAGDGTLTARVEAAGELARTTAVSGADSASGEGMQVTGGEEYAGLGYTLGRDDVALRELFVLDTADGTTAITEISFRAGTAPTAAAPEGVWPWPGDVPENEDVWLTDPRETAMHYVAFRLGGELGNTEVSEFQQGDSNSGEVVFTGDVSTTVLVRRLDGVWHVEAAVTDLVDVSVRDDNATVDYELGTAGDVTTATQTYGGEPMVTGPAHREAGRGAAMATYTVGGEQVVSRMWLVLDTDDGPAGLAEVRLDPSAPAQEGNVPEWAVWNEGSLDAYALALEYLEDRLPPDVEHDARDVQFGDDRTAEVPWAAGVVLLRYEEGDDTHWFVEQAIGDSVQIESVRRTDTGITGELRLAQAGTATVIVGDRAIDVRNDVDEEGTIVPFTVERAPLGAPVRVVFRTDTGYVSLAERIVD